MTRLPKAPSRRERWSEFCAEQYQKATEMMIRAGSQEIEGRWDWLGFAVQRLGGIAKAAAAIGVSRQAIYTWLEEGLARVEFRNVARLSEAADVPMVYLMRRMGPYEPENQRNGGVHNN